MRFSKKNQKEPTITHNVKNCMWNACQQIISETLERVQLSFRDRINLMLMVTKVSFTLYDLELCLFETQFNTVSTVKHSFLHSEQFEKKLHGQPHMKHSLCIRVIHIHVHLQREDVISFAGRRDFARKIRCRCDDAVVSREINRKPERTSRQLGFRDNCNWNGNLLSDRTGHRDGGLRLLDESSEFLAQMGFQMKFNDRRNYDIEAASLFEFRFSMSKKRREGGKNQRGDNQKD